MTDLFGRLRLAIAFVAMLLATARAVFAETGVVTPAEAIQRAVAQRIGGQVSVEVTSLDTAVAPQRALHATPEPGGRAGEPMRFVLMVGRLRRGVAVATVKVVGTYARAARAIGRNETVTADDLQIVSGELPAVGMKRLPDAADVVGLIARRDIAAGEQLTQAVLDVPLAVRSGEAVVLTVKVGTVQVTTRALATSSGHEGEIVRVVPEGGKALRARITRPGAVEVVQ